MHSAIIAGGGGMVGGDSRRAEARHVSCGRSDFAHLLDVVINHPATRAARYRTKRQSVTWRDCQQQVHRRPDTNDTNTNRLGRARESPPGTSG
uniref:Uncharacterized protein n=1 Tax=Plectus sambesii TaxID=2011161 RepID=A0A914VEP7_9BILA